MDRRKLLESCTWKRQAVITLARVVEFRERLVLVVHGRILEEEQASGRFYRKDGRGPCRISVTDQVPNGPSQHSHTSST